MDPAAARAAGQHVIAARLKLHRSEEAYVVACLLPETTEAGARESVLRLALTADVPESYHVSQINRIATADVQKLALALDVMVAVNAEKRFLASALALCNGLATTFRCERVSLGWLQGGYVRLRAISRTERFDRQMAAVRALEAAMDETLDQDEEILWPPPEGATVVARDHEKLVREQSVGHLCSLPLRLEAKPAAVLLCERQSGPFTDGELQQLRLCCDQAARRLADLHRTDRWVGARLAVWLREQLAGLVGPKHTWAKAAALLGVVVVAILFFLRVPYRVEGTFVLKSEQVSYRTAPFDGYIEEVSVRPGDVVKAGDKLLKLVTRELELEETAAQADVSRFLREAERARATNGLAEMKVALALGEQAKARFDLVRYRLSEATVKAPFDGVVVEGDLRERLAAPVKQGDALMKVARLENLYVEAEVNERDIHEILNRQRGEIAFVSQPKLKFPVRIVKIEPAAFPRTEGNVFLVRCEFSQALERWWRPGMSGLCKLGVENRTLWWILTHRTVDFLRMKLWW
jgi:multidrug resistance efflux pump